LSFTLSGLASTLKVRTNSSITSGMALLIGLYLVSIGGWPILLIGFVCLLAGLTYTGGPWPFGYHGLGDLVCFICFGVLAVLGTAYLHRLELTPLDIWASIPVGRLVPAILIVNNLRDI